MNTEYTYEILPPILICDRWLVYRLDYRGLAQFLRVFDTEIEAKNYILIEKLSE
jgi:hypothetical protein